MVAANASLRRLRSFYQQETQQRVPLLADVTQSPPLSTRLLRRHLSQIAAQFLAVLEPSRIADDEHERQRPTCFARQLREAAIARRTFILVRL